MRIILTEFCEHYNHGVTKIFASYSFRLDFLAHYGNKVQKIKKFCEYYFHSVTQKVLWDNEFGQKVEWSYARKLCQNYFHSVTKIGAEI